MGSLMGSYVVVVDLHTTFFCVCAHHGTGGYNIEPVFGLSRGCGLGDVEVHVYMV